MRRGACAVPGFPGPSRRAIFEYDRLVRSSNTLRYLRDPQLQRNVHCSQNRIESYHQLRSAIAQVGGKKKLIDRTDLEIEVSNQCVRLIANAIVYYNSAILSRLLEKDEASGKWIAKVMHGHLTKPDGTDEYDSLEDLLADLAMVGIRKIQIEWDELPASGRRW